MNAVVLTAVLSCLNSGLYTASRMLFVLAARHVKPSVELVKVGRRGVALRRHSLFVGGGLSGACYMAWVMRPAARVFVFLLKSSGALVLSVYLLIRPVADRVASPDTAGAAAGEDVVQLSRRCRS